MGLERMAQILQVGVWGHEGTAWKELVGGVDVQCEGCGGMGLARMPQILQVRASLDGWDSDR